VGVGRSEVVAAGIAPSDNCCGSLFGYSRRGPAKDGGNQAIEAGILAKTIERRVYANRDQPDGPFFMSFFQPFDSALVVAQADEQIGTRPDRGAGVKRAIQAIFLAVRSANRGLPSRICSTALVHVAVNE
jgi:hypothetical protein